MGGAAITGPERTLALLGGTQVLGRSVDSHLALAELVAAGLPSGALDAVLVHFAASAIPRGRVYQVVGNERTLQRKRREHAVLSTDESDKLARLARVAALADEMLGSRDRGSRWLGTPNRALDGHMPLLSSGPMQAPSSSNRCWGGSRTAWSADPGSATVLLTSTQAIVDVSAPHSS